MPSFPFRRQGGNGSNQRGPLDYSGIQPGRTMASVIGRRRFPYIHAPGPGFRSAEHLVRQPHPRAQAHYQDIPVQTRHSLFNDTHNRHQVGPQTRAHISAHQLAHMRGAQTVPIRVVADGHRCHQAAFTPTTHTQPRRVHLVNLQTGPPVTIRARRPDGRHHADPRPCHHRRRRLHDTSDIYTDGEHTVVFDESDWSSDDESQLGVPSFLREGHDRRRRRRTGRRRVHSRDRSPDGSSADESIFVFDDEYDEPWSSDRRWDGSRSYVRKRPEDMYWWFGQ
ncbi:hypothetical protein MferCBS31731_007594 [Microsporum ferrugineum]